MIKMQTDFSSLKICHGRHSLLFPDMRRLTLAIDLITLTVKPLTARNHWQEGWPKG